MVRALIVEMVEYVEAGRAGPLLSDLENRLGKHDLRVLSIKVLDWIKGRVRLKKRWQLPLDVQHRWTQNMRAVIESEEAFSDLFQITVEGKLDFASPLSNAKQDEIEEYVNSHFHPPLFTTRA